MHEVLYQKEMFYIKTNVSGVSLGAGLLQLREEMKCLINEVTEVMPHSISH